MPGGRLGGRRRHTAVWTLVALTVLALYLRAVGVDAVVGAFGRVEPRDAALLVALGSAPLLCWGVALHLVLDRLEVPTSLPVSVALFAAAGFLNSVTPFGQAGGDPVSGALVARVGRTPFERGLAAVVSVSAANAVAVVGLGVVGVGVLVGTARVADARPVVAAAFGVGLAAAVGLLGVGAWRRRDRLAGAVGGSLGGLLERTGAALPGVDPPARTAVVARTRGFVAALERVADAPERLAAVLALGACGHVAVATTLWAALATLGAPVGPAVVLVIVPVAKLAGVSPTPGGTASAELLLTGLLVGVGGVPAPVAAAATLLYRAAAFWLPTVGGGVLMVALLAVSGQS